MNYSNMKEALFLQRPNRFIAHVLLEGQEVVCHVKNTGRCRELLIPGKAIVYVEDHGEDRKRKTRYSLIAVKKGERLVNMDSQAPNKVAREWLEAGEIGALSLVQSEKIFGQSRLDYYYEYPDGRKGFMEVKGVTLEQDGVVSFPDAPTERGVKHLEELIQIRKLGYEARVLFVVQMDHVRYFQPNDQHHKAFGDALRKAEKEGVIIQAVTCQVTKDSLCYHQPLEVVLGND